MKEYREEVATKVIDAAYCVHKNLGPGLLEKVYEVCFCHELKKRKLNYQTQVSVPIKYDGVMIDEGFRLDVIIENQIVCELKAVSVAQPVWNSQLLTYLKLMNKELGFIINFGAPTIKEGIKRMVCSSN